MIRALVVDDSQFMRTVISDVLEEGGIEVVGKASNGEKAIRKVEELEPDVVTMDVQMPKMDGLEAVKRIMEENPTPILMLSAYTDEGADATFDALDRGAVDFMSKPGGEVSTSLSQMKEELVEKVRAVARADVRTKRPSMEARAPPEPEAGEEMEMEAADEPTVIFGASTGGPSALETVLSELPYSSNLRILIVQHMPDNFTESFANRLDRKSQYDISQAEDGDTISGGEGLLAKGDFHMEVSRYRRGRLSVELNQDPPLHNVRPAIDVTMMSAANVVDDDLVGVVMTGMGKDGAKGIKALKGRGARTIAQDEETSAVYGIPGSAVETGSVDEILPLDGIAEGVARAVKKGQVA